MNANEERFEKKKSGINTYSSERERERKGTCRVVGWCYVVLGLALYLWDAVESVFLVVFCGSRKRRNDISTDTRFYMTPSSFSCIPYPQFTCSSEIETDK